MSQPTKEKQAPESSYPPGGNSITEISFERLMRFLEKWAEKLVPHPEPSKPIPPWPDSRPSVFLLFLKSLPFLCIAGFLVSLFWDNLPYEIELPWYDEPKELRGLLRMITVTGLVGFATNWLAIKMLFYPRKKRPLLGQGLIPSRKDRIVLKLGEQISREIINADLILDQIRKTGLVSKHRARLAQSMRNILNNKEFRDDIVEVSQHYINIFLRSPEFRERLRDFVKGIDFENVGAFEGGMLRLYKVLTGNDEISSRLQEVIDNLTFRMDRYDDRLISYLHKVPDSIENDSEAIENFALNAIVFLIEQVNVQNVIIDNLQGFDEVRLERLLWRSTSDQLQYIQYLGCFLGLVGGLFIWLPFEAIAVFSLIGGMVWGADVLIMRLRGQTPAVDYDDEPDDDEDVP